MKLQLLLSCLSLLTITVQSMSLIAERKSAVTKYSLELSSGGKTFGEQIEIDTIKETETFHVPKTSPNESAGDIIYDFKRKVTMVRLPAEKACYIANSIDETLTPADLKEALEMKSPGTSEELATSSTETQMTVAGELEDRSALSAEMAELCVNLPIYIVTNGAVILNDEDADEETVVEDDMEADMEADEYIDEDANDEPEIVDTIDNPYTRVKRAFFRKLRRKGFLRKLKKKACKRVCKWATRRICRRVPDLFNRLRRRCLKFRKRGCKRVCRWLVG